MDRPTNRTIQRQEFLSIALAVGITPTAISQTAQQSSLQSMYETIVVCVPSTAANSVWIGNANIKVASMNGQEVIAGQSLMWRIINERQLYEIQGPLVDQFCKPLELIPFKAWDVSTIYLVATAATTVGITLFKGSLF